MLDASHFWPAFASGFAFFTGSALTLFLSTLSRKEPATRAFILTTLATGVWGLFAFLFDTTPVTDLGLARVWKIGSQILNPIIAATVCNFALVYYQEVVGGAPYVYRIIRNAMIVGAGILGILLVSDLLGFSTLLVKEIVAGAGNLLEPVPGPFFHFIYIHFFGGALYATYVIFSVLKKNNLPIVRSQVRLIVSSVVFAMIAGGTRFATWYHFPVSANIAALAAPALGLGITYAITRRHLFNARVISTEIFTVSIWALLFFLIVFSPTTSERIVNSVVFFATVILGIFLIRGTLRESAQKEELAKANAALKNLNQNLEEIVRERTGELNRAKLHTDAIIENLVLGLIEYRSDFTILRVNKAAEELLGFSRTNIAGKKITGEDVTIKEFSSLAEVIHLDPNNENLRNDQFPVPGVTSEITVRYPSPRNLQIITFPVVSEEQGWGGERKQFVKIIRDITREKLIDKNKSDFITIVAHQLRTPLSAIKWAFNMALGTNHEAFNKDQLDSLMDGYQANERMINLINDLLNVIYIEDGRFGYEFKQDDIIKTVTEVIASMKTTAHWKKVSLELDLPSEPITPFAFDASRISLALTNIVENGINYTPSGGRIKLTVKKESGAVKIIVGDNGMGIPRDEMQKLLVTKFFRSVKALRAQTDGSGLGLFIANNIIQTHKGVVDIKSEEDKGTVVSITIPTTLTEKDAPRVTHPQIEPPKI